MQLREDQEHLLEQESAKPYIPLWLADTAWVALLAGLFIPALQDLPTPVKGGVVAFWLLTQIDPHSWIRPIEWTLWLWKMIKSLSKG